jgi:alpha-mannosidase
MRVDGEMLKPFKRHISLMYLYKDENKGRLPQAMSMVNIDSDNIILETIKKAEDSDDIIIRLYECYNRRTNASINFFREIESVVECNLMERDLNKVESSKNSFTSEFKPYEIKTFKIKLK